MADHLPKFPESLPPPVEIIEGVPEVHLSSADLSTTAAIEDLVGDLYWHADGLYYLFFEYGVGIAPNFLQQLESHGIRSEKTELYFFRHPCSRDECHFVRILPGEAEFDWEHKAAASQMHGRVTLGLASWRKKKIHLTHAAEATVSVIAKQEPILELKPNFAGFGINLHSVLRKIKTWWQKTKG